MTENRLKLNVTSNIFYRECVKWLGHKKVKKKKRDNIDVDDIKISLKSEDEKERLVKYRKNIIKWEKRLVSLREDFFDPYKKI